MRELLSILIGILVISGLNAFSGTTGPELFLPENNEVVLDTIPVKERYGNFVTDPKTNPFDITPSIVEQKVEYDPVSGNYIVFEKIGDEYYRTPSYLTFNEYMDWRAKQEEKDYFNQLAGINTGKRGPRAVIDPMERIDIQGNLVDRLFGGTEVNIQPKGNVDLTFGLDYYRNENPNIPLRQQSPGILFDFDMDIDLAVDGNIGEKLNLGFNYDTQASFDFDRKIKLEYDTEAFSEDDIIKKIEAGNVSLGMTSSLIPSKQNLFGLKTELQFGKLKLTAIASQQRSEQNNLRIENGASIQEFELTPDQYDENRHFFISHFNRDSYEDNLKNLPYIGTSFRITRMEVWISEDRTDYQQGSKLIAAISDLAEPDESKFTNTNSNYDPPMIQDPILLGVGGIPLADNRVNSLYQDLQDDNEVDDIDKASTILKSKFNMEQIRDFEVFRGRRLNPSEYTFHPQLGFISLNIRLRPNQKLGVSYQYYYTANCDEVYQVGDMSSEGEGNTVINQQNPEDIPSPNLTFVKMLKSSNQRPSLSSWDLMMKNVYPLNTSQLTAEDFQFDIFFEDETDGSLKKYIPFGDLRYRPLLQVFGLDTLNALLDPQPDGVFDFVPGVTVIQRSGSIVFPVLEPFGKSLAGLLGNQQLADSLAYQALYDTTLIGAREQLENNKFRMLGKVKSDFSGEISLGPFVPQGSVRVTAGGRTLQEGADYEIDYSLGRLRIINPAYLQQGTPVNVSFEDNALFSLQQKTMLGLRAEYEVSDKLNIGGTYMRLFERPFTEKVNLGDDPINNRVFGLDMNYSTESSVLTKALDKLPFYSTKEPSFINFSAEVAALKPGHSGAINLSGDDSGVVNIDDFEGTVSGIFLGSTRTNDWVMASTPPAYAESELRSLEYGANRALLNWYVIDNNARSGGAGDRGDSYTRLIQQDELFQRQTEIGLSNLFTFDLSYYPSERGPYNFDVPGGTAYSAGVRLNEDGSDVVLKNPAERWGGIMRIFHNTDFEAANYESIEFWMLNPFMERRDGANHVPGEIGKMVLQLGSVSEDVLKDGSQFYENSIPIDPDKSGGLKPTVWGRVSNIVPVVDGFDNQEGAVQDIGFDGLNDEQEIEFYQDWLNTIGATFPVPPIVRQDPSNDNYVYFNSESFPEDEDLLTRLRRFNGPEGNAPLTSQTSNNERLRGNPRPDKEDLNSNNSLDEAESYYEYVIDIINEGGEVDPSGSEYIREIRTTTNPSTNEEEKWYRFRIPLQDGESVNGIQGLRGIQFMRMYVTNFSSAKTFRLAEFQLRRNQWRLYQPFCEGDNAPDVDFTLDDVGIEENSTKQPFNYVTPRGIKQERVFSTFNNLLQDEKSMALNFCNMGQGCSASMYKLSNLDLTYYKKLQMFVHAEREELDPELDDNEVSVFIRLGKDFTQNYYEYEMPLVLSDENQGAGRQENIWRDTNYVNFPLDILKNLKILRNEANVSVNEPFATTDPDNPRAIRRIQGNPSLGRIKVIQIGIRNVDSENVTHCGEVWVNELRASGLENRGGYAGLARMQMQLADLGELNLSGSYNSIGWGAIDEKLQERAREETVQYDISSNLELGKFFPNGLGLSVPFYFQHSKLVSKPQFDPYEQDLTVEEAKLLADTPEEEADIEERAKETTTINAFNFTNVKKTSSGGGSKKPWSVDNFSVSYAYSETVKTDPIIKENKVVETSLGMDYRYSAKAKYWEPFKGIKSDALKFISGFNFNFIPNSFSFNTTVDRYRGNRTFRLPDVPVFTFDDKRFKWDRQYNLKWDFTKSLNFDFNAQASSVIDELRQVGIADDPNDRPWVTENGEDVSARVKDDPGYVREYWWDNFRRLGRGKGYDHKMRLSYNVPIKLLPMMDWVTVKADYTADYAWEAGPLIVIDEFGNGPGNIIQNRQSRTFTGTFSFDKLYSKWGYLKRVEDGGSAGNTGRTRRTRSTRRNNTSENQAGDQTKEEEKPPRNPSTIERILIRPLMSIRSLRVTLKEDFSTLIPGFNPEAKLLGLSSGFDAPGLGFIAGFQPDLDRLNDNNWLRQAADNGWINSSYNINDQISQQESNNLTMNLTIEPFKDFEIDLDFNKRYSRTHTEVFKNKQATGDPEFLQLAGYDVGSFEETFFAFNTLFGRSPEVLYSTFKENRKVISNRLPNEPGVGEHPSDPGYAYGYGERSYDVIVPAFLAAYEGKDVNTYNLDLENKVSKSLRIPAPSWSLRYDGLKNLPWFKDILSSFSLNHSYKSTMRVNQFNSIPNYNGLNFEIDNGDNYYTRLEIPALSIIEQFAPLVGLSFKTKNDMNFDFQYKKGRQLNLALQTELRESRNTEFVVGFGYTIKDFKGFFGGGGNKRTRSRRNQEETQQQNQDAGNQQGNVTSSRGKTLKVNVDFSIRDDISYIFNFLDTADEPSPERGTKEISINPNVDYDINENLTMRFFVQYRKSIPKTSLSYTTTNVSGGVTLRFKLN